MTLEHAMRQVLAEMTLISYGKTQAFDASGGKSENPDPRPSGESKPMVDHWRERFEHERSHRTLEQAREALDAWKRRATPAPEFTYDEDAEILKTGEGFSVDQVARKFGCTPTRVRKLRMAADRDTEFGLPKEFARVVAATPDRIRDLAAQGCTERQIAFQVSVSKSTVRRALGRAA